MTYFVYVDSKPDGTPFYVGKGNALRMGFKQRNVWHTRICEKYPDWVRERVFEGTEQDCFTQEIALIALYGRRDLGEGTLVNMTDGGEGTSGRIKSPEEREKIAAAKRGKPRPLHVIEAARKANTGRKQNPEVVKKRGAMQTGKKRSAETIARMKEARKKVVYSPETKAKLSAMFKGKPRSDASRARMSASAKMRAPFSAETRAKLSAATKRSHAEGKIRNKVVEKMKSSEVK